MWQRVTSYDGGGVISESVLDFYDRDNNFVHETIGNQESTFTFEHFYRISNKHIFFILNDFANPHDFRVYNLQYVNENEFTGSENRSTRVTITRILL